MIGPTTPSTASPCARWNASTAWRVCGPKIPSAGIPSARCAAATAGPRLPKRRLPDETLLVAVLDCARTTWAAGAISVAATSAAETVPFDGPGRRAAASSRRRAERSIDRCHSSWRARSRFPGGCANSPHSSDVAACAVPLMSARPPDGTDLG